MLNKLKGLFGKSGLPATLTAEQEQSILTKGSPKERKELAARKDARPEVLYYLADDSEPEVRRLIAANPATPVQADDKLTNDSDEQVRAELARKISRIVPGLPKNEAEALREKTIAVLEKLATDQIAKVRGIVAEEIKASSMVPKEIIDQLARDIEDIVALPILEYSPLLNDDDLREIIAAGASSTRLSAMARRAVVSEAVSDDIAASLDIPAVAALLTNENAQIREDTLDQIINQAEGVEALHKPVALRPQLSIRAMKRIAGFVASALVHQMISQSDLEEDMLEGVMDRVRERIEGERVGEDEEAEIAKKALEFQKRGMLNDDFVIEQIEENRRELLIQCLALMAEITAKEVRAVIHSKSGRAVTALAWRSGLLMRTAYELQTKFALVPSAQLLHGKDGNKYPIDNDELEWHLSYFLEKG